MSPSFDPTRLVESEGNPPPAGLKAFPFTTPDGKRLRVAMAPSAGERTRGTIIILQGRNEAIEKYFETISDLAELGYMTLTFDWRGQGGSQRLIADPHRGHVRSIGNYVNDLEAIVQEIVLPDCRGPYAVLAHSMGGLIALQAMPRLATIVERMVLGAPLVAFPKGLVGTSTLSRAAGLAKLAGLGTLPIRPSFVTGARMMPTLQPLSSDPKRLERNRALAKAAPELFLGSPTISWFSAVTRSMRRLEDSDVIARMAVPTLVIAAGADRVVSTSAAERLAWRMRSGSSLTIPFARHEILQEADIYREPFLEAFEAFVGHALPKK